MYLSFSCYLFDSGPGVTGVGCGVCGNVAIDGGGDIRGASGVADVGYKGYSGLGVTSDVSSWDSSGEIDVRWVGNGSVAFNGDTSTCECATGVVFSDGFKVRHEDEGRTVLGGDTSSWDVSDVYNLGGGAAPSNSDASSWDVSGFAGIGATSKSDDDSDLRFFALASSDFYF